MPLNPEEIIYQLPPVPFKGPDVLTLSGRELVDYPLKSWGIEEVHEMGVTGSHVRIGVGDTGVSKHHLQGTKELANVDEYESFVGGDVFDRNGHGSHVAGIIGAIGNNDVGLKGHAPLCSISSAKVLSDNGSGGDSGIAAGIRWMVDRGCLVINLSLGSQGRSQRIMDAISYGVSNNVIFVCAAGNDGRDVDFPAAGGGSVIGCAVDWNLKPANFSSPGPSVTNRGVCGAGVEVYSCTSNAYARWSGTSMASPCISAHIALIIDAELRFLKEQRTKTWQDVIEWTNKFPSDMGTAGDDPKCGQGGLDVNSIVKAIKAESEGDKPDPEPGPGSEYLAGTIKDEGRTYSVYREL